MSDLNINSCHTRREEYDFEYSLNSMNLGHLNNPFTEISIIPSPKEIALHGGVQVSRTSCAVYRIVVCDPKPEVSRSAAIIAAELEEVGGEVIEDENVTVDFTVELIVTGHLSNSSPEAYRLMIGDTIRMEANAPAGLLYAMATLRQLLARSPSGAVSLPRCQIYDYPDIEYRCAARWLVELEGSRMMYDWGDGREKMLERYRRKIDFCMRYKINMAFFEGFEWRTDKYPQYVEDIRTLNHYAAERNVMLEFGGHGIGFGGFPGHTLEGLKGLGGYNRYSYPDGEIYSCGRVPGVDFDRFRPSITSDAMHNGTCRSNDALNALKQKELAEYVRLLEPRVLYIHNEDIAAYSEFAEMWQHRCPACRRRWPNDAIASEDGAAGAIGHGLQCLYEGISSVRNADTGYHGERDCLVIFASPTYGAMEDKDDIWDGISDFWTVVSRVMKNSSRILFCVREQFYREDGNTLRIRELADRLQREGGNHGLFGFIVSGADLYSDAALFTAAPRMNHFFAGARALFNFNGGLFASPQEIYNAEYAWNLRSPYGTDEAENCQEARALYFRRVRKLELIDQDPLLERACQLCYGEAAGEMVAFYTLRDEDCRYPATILFALFRTFFRRRYRDYNREEQERRWKGIHLQTQRAIRLIEVALQRDLPSPEVKEELVYLRTNLLAGSKVTAVVAGIWGLSPDWTAIRQQIEVLRDWIVETCPDDFTSRFEGEMSLWPGYLDKLLRFIDERDESRVLAVGND